MENIWKNIWKGMADDEIKKAVEKLTEEEKSIIKNTKGKPFGIHDAFSVDIMNVSVTEENRDIIVKLQNEGILIVSKIIDPDSSLDGDAIFKVTEPFGSDILEYLLK